jgi:hypothetical protein
MNENKIIKNINKLLKEFTTDTTRKEKKNSDAERIVRKFAGIKIYNDPFSSSIIIKPSDKYSQEKVVDWIINNLKGYQDLHSDDFGIQINY